MFRIIHPNRWLFWFVAIALSIISIVWWQGQLFFIEQDQIQINSQQIPQAQPPLGGDRDVHGCIDSAGYSWCEVKQKCLRVWEEPCDTVTTTEQTEIDTSTWKTYKSEKSGIEFKYPKIGYEQKFEDSPHEYWSGIIMKSRLSGPAGDFRKAIHVSVRDNPKKLSLKDWFLDGNTCQEILFDSGYLYTDTLNTMEHLESSGSEVPLPDRYNLDDCGPIGYINYIKSPDATKIVGISYDYQDTGVDELGFNSSQELHAYLNKILSTVRFTEKTLSEIVLSENEVQNPDLMFANKLRTCSLYKTTFKHPLTAEILQKEILGIINGKCGYVEQMPNQGKMECTYTESERNVIAQYYEDIATATSVGTSATVDITSNKTITTYTINGKSVANPLQEALNNGACLITGY